MNIVLIGYRGTGKTSVAKLLSTILNMELVEVDRLITKRAKLSIPQIVERFGWDVFRDIESDVIKEVSLMDNCIIDTGGGVILREENVERLKENGIIFWLTADKEIIKERIRGSEDRPSLTGKKSFIDEIDEVLKEREPLYRAAADWRIKTDKSTIEGVCEEILKILLQQEDTDDFRDKLEKGLRMIEEIEQEC